MVETVLGWFESLEENNTFGIILFEGCFLYMYIFFLVETIE